MARTALTLSTLLLASACGSPDVAAGTPADAAAPPPLPLAIQPGQPFALKPGQVAMLAGADGMRIGFAGVSADSRCPKGEQCVWAGDATVQVWLQVGVGPRQPAELHTAPGRAGSVGVAGRSLRLQGLDPWPVSGRQIVPADYTAHLLLELGNAGSDR